MLAIFSITESWDELEREYGRFINHFWTATRAGCDVEPEIDWSVFTMDRDGDGAISVDECIAGALSEDEAKRLVNQHNATVVSALSMCDFPKGGK